MEARYVEAGSMSIFWTQNRALSKPPALHVSRYVLGGTRWVRALLYGGTQIGLGGTRWVPALLYVGPKSGSVGRGGTRWVPALLYVGPYTPFGFYNAT